MKAIKITLFGLFFLVFSCERNVSKNAASAIQIIPQPAHISADTNHYIIFKDSLSIQFSERFEVAGNWLTDYISRGSGIAAKQHSQNGQIQFIEDHTITNKEGYELEITEDHIVIRASTDRGAFYAVQSLRQLLPSAFENGTYVKKELSIPCATIKDAPVFDYRGMHLDVGRHLFPVEFIKKYIDALAMLKLNTFHWHLTEDQGWRIEIKQYPKLQQVAAFRPETLIGHYNDQPHQFDGTTYGGYYTQTQIKDIVAYAQKRHVTIIPEIEMPGHSQAAIAAYPELGCTGEPIEVATKWGVFEDIYCTKESTFEFLENVLDEVITLFPSTYIHIGGDEAPKTRWKNCASCQQRIKDEGLKDEHELQSYFIARIEKYLNSKGRQIIGWDEILEGGLAPNATVMSWRGTQGAIAAAQQQHNVIMSPTSHCYFDYYQSENDDEPLAIGGYLPLEKVYHFNPIPEELTTEESQYIRGAQGNVWTEYMPTTDQVEYMVFPRILALSEVVWTPSHNKDYNNFVERVEQFHQRLDALNINYANHFYEIEGVVQNQKGETTFQLAVPSSEHRIYYTIDGKTPHINSKPYHTPIPIEKSLTIKAAVFNDEGQQLGKTYEQFINYHKGVGQSITINKSPHKSYPGSGAEGLINGISGSDKRYGDKEWLGFWGNDLEIIITFDQETEVNSLETRFHNGQGQWIYAPKEIEIQFDNEDPITKTVSNDQLIVKVDMKFDPKVTKRIKLSVPNYGLIPEGKQGAGHKAWTFIDEIIIN